MRFVLGTSRAAVVVAICLTALLVGCGSDSESNTLQQESQQQVAREERRLRRAEARERRQAARRRARRAAARELAREEARERREAEAREAVEAEERHEAVEAEASECDPNYVGACLDPNSYDYDCAGGSGDGPDYTGPVTVVGSDHYGLDADGDGQGCE
jgi:hypothetical protein